MGDDDLISQFTREKIARISEDALRRADVVGVFPTPMEEVQRIAGVRERIDMAQLPDPVKAQKPGVLKRILGAYWFEERTVFIDTGQPQPRQLFTDGHEAIHVLCPWHEDILMLDTADELFKNRHPGIEAEANFGSGHLIFQGGRFHQRALEDQVSMRTPLAIHNDYGASRHAALHYYAQGHPDAVALLITGRFPGSDGALPIWRSVQSAEFSRRFGRFEDRLPPDALSVDDRHSGLFTEIVTASRSAVDPPTMGMRLEERDGHERKFVVEAFFNEYCFFVMAVERKARRLGKRLRIAS